MLSVGRENDNKMNQLKLQQNDVVRVLAKAMKTDRLADCRTLQLAVSVEHTCKYPLFLQYKITDYIQNGFQRPLWIFN